MKRASAYLGVFNACLLFTLLFIGYLEFYFTADRSITFRMLIIADKFGDFALSTSDLLAIYDTENVIISRCRILKVEDTF